MIRNIIENNQLEINTIIFNELINNSSDIFRASKYSKAKISVVEVSIPTEMPTYTINQNGTLIIEICPIPILTSGIYVIAQQPLSASVDKDNVSDDIKEQINLIKTNAWCIGDLANAVKLYGKEIMSLPIQKVKMLDIITIQNLITHEMTKVITVAMLYITQRTLERLYPDEAGKFMLKSVNRQGNELEFELTKGMYVVNYGNGEIEPLQKLDYDKTYLRC